MNTIGLHAKRGIEATFEKVVRASGSNPAKITIVWSGGGAGVNISGDDVGLKLPRVSDSALVSRSEFVVLVGYAVHEFGHVKFTDSIAWRNAVATPAAGNDQFLHRLINGLEDPRIENEVIERSICANARSLFEAVLSNVLLKDNDGGDYVDPDDINNIAFQFAVEGRRLNGYSVPVAPVYQRSKYRDIIEYGLTEARKCVSTTEIIKVAKEVQSRLLERQQQQQEQEQQQQDQQQDQQQGGDQSGDQQDDQSNDQQGDQDGDQSGSGDELGEKQDGDLPAGSKKGELSIEPSDRIGEVFASVVDGSARPTVKSKRFKIEWRDL